MVTAGTLEVLPLSSTDAKRIASWRYGGAYSVYDRASDGASDARLYLLDPSNGFYAVRSHNDLLGFCSFGADARVPGGTYDDRALDVGAGMDPALVGKGHGRVFLEAVVAYGFRELNASVLRVTIASWNERALRAARSVDFRPVWSFRSNLGADFTVLTRGATDRAPRLEDVIAAHLAQSEAAYVEQAIYGAAEPEAIASALRDFCRHDLGEEVACALFYRSSIGSVAGLELRDGRRVVVKAHQPGASRQHLDEIVQLRKHLATRQLYTAPVLMGPSTLGHGLATVETLDERGETRDAHDPGVRRALASSMHTLVLALEPFVEASSLPPQLLSSAAAGKLWPTPHSRLFDFEATRAGAEDIEAIAASARAGMTATGRVVIGHGDWRTEHVRFVGNEPVVAFDWDSLCKDREPFLIGFTAHAFCADWSRNDYASAPTLEEARAFVLDYEQARGAAFTSEERAACAAAFAYSVAYTARCVHALGLDERREPGTFQHLLASHAHGLLSL